MEKLIKNNEAAHKALVQLPGKLAKHPAGSAARFIALLEADTDALAFQLGCRKFCKDSIVKKDNILRGIIYTRRYGDYTVEITEALKELLGVHVHVKKFHSCFYYTFDIPLPDDYDDMVIERKIREAEKEAKEAAQRIKELKRKKRTNQDAKKKKAT